MTFCGLEGRIAARYGLLPAHGWPDALRRAFVEVGRARRLAGPALVLESFNDPSVLRELAGWLAVTDTAFFRDPVMFRSIARKLRRTPSVGSSRPVRIWSAGCSTGQEVYSLALTLLDRLPMEVALQISVLGTDLVRSAIEKARSARYSDAETAFLNEAQLRRHAHRVSGGWRFAEPVRAMVSFEHLSIQESLEQYEPRSFDTILFCDVAPYLDRATVERMCQGFHRVLEPCGHLFIGPGDPAPTEDLFVRDSDQRSFWRVARNVSVSVNPRNRDTCRPLANSLRRSLAPGSPSNAPAATGCDSQSVLRAANEAIQLRPTDGLGYLLRGRILLSSSRPEAANEDLRRATYLLDCDELAEYWYLRAAQLNGRLDKARPRLVRLIHRLSCRAPEDTLFDGRTTVGELLDASMLLKQQLG